MTAVPSPGPIRVHVVDNDRLAGRLLAEHLASQPRLAVIGTSASRGELLAALATESADVVLMDIEMPGMDGFAATRAVQACHPGVRVLLITCMEDETTQQRAFEAGARGVLIKADALDGIAEAISAVHCGHHLFSEASLVHEQTAHRRPLTAREKETLALIGTGATNAAIAAQLHVSLSTVKATVHSLLRTFGVDNRIRLAQLALIVGSGVPS